MADAEGFRALYDASEVMYDITAHQKLLTFSHIYIGQQKDTQKGKYKSKHSMLSQILPPGKVDINKKNFNQTSWWSYVFETKEVRHL